MAAKYKFLTGSNLDSILKAKKLAMSKKIMDKHNTVPRNQSNGLGMVNENTNATYNIPQDMVNNTVQPSPNISETISTKTVNSDAVLNSKLPDEIAVISIVSVDDVISTGCLMPLPPA